MHLCKECDSTIRNFKYYHIRIFSIFTYILFQVTCFTPPRREIRLPLNSVKINNSINDTLLVRFTIPFPTNLLSIIEKGSQLRLPM